MHDLHGLEELRITGCAQVGRVGVCRQLMGGQLMVGHTCGGRVAWAADGGAHTWAGDAWAAEGRAHTGRDWRPQVHRAAAPFNGPPFGPPPHPLQVCNLRLQSQRLSRLELCGTRALQELEMRCARLAEVAIRPLNPGLAACAALK